jgi:hypothetical protein
MKDKQCYRETKDDRPSPLVRFHAHDHATDEDRSDPIAPGCIFGIRDESIKISHRARKD